VAATTCASDPLTRAAEIGLAEAGDLSREPREAIIACYAAMEHELENSPDVVPRESDTPTEVLARAVEHRALRADSATELVELFEEARFSPHVMTEQHREAAVRVLRLVLAELRSVA
jgi:spore germination protein GerM